MRYDTIKGPLGRFFNTTPAMRVFFYKLLDLLLLRSWHIRKELRRFAAYRQNLHVLDAGSGFGQYVHYMSRPQWNWNVKGVDVKQEQIDDCNQFFKSIGRSQRVQFGYADLTAFNEPNRYDLILSVDVMEHIEEDEKVFVNFYSSMKNGGMLLISTPSDQGGSDTHEHHDGEVKGFIEEHVRDGYNIIDIAEKLKRAGFTNINAKYSYGRPGKLSWLLSMKYPILMLNFSKLLFAILPFYYLLVYPFCLVLNWVDVSTYHKTGTGLIVTATKQGD
jgi:2-polyprenyl-3-methyl-5-hydroxy-6-metoxy-1,4-benzoquinol methylase